MNSRARDLLISGCLGVLLLTVSAVLSVGPATIGTPGTPVCYSGTKTGFPFPFIYSVQKNSSVVYPSTHSTPSCPGTFAYAGVDPVTLGVDYVVWFAVSFTIVLALTQIFSKKSVISEELKQRATPQ